MICHFRGIAGMKLYIKFEVSSFIMVLEIYSRYVRFLRDHVTRVTSTFGQIICLFGDLPR